MNHPYRSGSKTLERPPRPSVVATLFFLLISIALFVCGACSLSPTGIAVLCSGGSLASLFAIFAAEDFGRRQERALAWDRAHEPAAEPEPEPWPIWQRLSLDPWVVQNAIAALAESDNDHARKALKALHHDLVLALAIAEKKRKALS